MIYIASEEPFELFARPSHVISCIAGDTAVKKFTYLADDTKFTTYSFRVQIISIFVSTFDNPPPQIATVHQNVGIFCCYP